MRASERGLLMLTCSLGDPAARPLAPQQYVAVGKLLRRTPPARTETETLTCSDLTRAGISEEYTRQILSLLDREKQLDAYLDAGDRCGVSVVTILSSSYPASLRQKLGDEAPTALFCKGDLSLLQEPCVSLVGSRRLGEEGSRFARTVGGLAARSGRTLVSGGAAGADQTGQNACLSAGGSVLVFTPERLDRIFCGDGVLLVSEDGFHLPFSAERALSRNRLIHAMGEATFVAQCTYRRGGTWRGSLYNLRRNLSPLYICDDGTQASRELIQEGATGISDLDRLSDLFQKINRINRD